jgi:hypothetical protein
VALVLIYEYGLIGVCKDTSFPAVGLDVDIGCKLFWRIDLSFTTNDLYCLISRMAEIQWIHGDWTTLIWNKLSYQYSRQVAPKAIAIKLGSFISQEAWENEYK